MEGSKFIITKSKLIAGILRDSGYTFMSYQGDVWTFLNDGKHSFSKNDKKEMVFTDKIFL